MVTSDTFSKSTSLTFPLATSEAELYHYQQKLNVCNACQCAFHHPNNLTALLPMGGLSAHTSKKKRKKKRKKQIGDSARKLNIALLYSVPLKTPKIIPPEGL